MKRFSVRAVTCMGALALGLVGVAPAANASSAGPTILAHIGSTENSTQYWKSTPSHTPDVDYQACVAIYGYDEAKDGDGWNISYRYSSSHISFWVGKNYHHDVSSYCGPWKTDSKSSTYTRVTASYNSYIREADVWQYWN